MRVVWAFAVIVVCAMVWGLVLLLPGKQVSANTLKRMRLTLLILAGVGGGYVSLAASGAALWSGVVFPFLAPALVLPAFLLLLLGSTRILAGIMWLLTAVSPIDWYLSLRMEAAHPVSSADALSALFNFFTLLVICISMLVQIAALSERKEFSQHEQSSMAEISN